MILSKLELYNFRQFKAKEGRPGFSVTFHKGLNALIGENDSGKTPLLMQLNLYCSHKVMNIFMRQMKILY